MHTTDITTENFESHIASEGVLFLDVWAPWCGPCRAFGPIYEAMAEKHPDITWGKVNSQEQPALAQAFGIRAIPTLMVFRDGILVFQQAGLIPEQGLAQLVEQVRALDMGEVRKELEEARQKTAAQR